MPIKIAKVPKPNWVVIFASVAALCMIAALVVSTIGLWWSIVPLTPLCTPVRDNPMSDTQILAFILLPMGICAFGVLLAGLALVMINLAERLHKE